MGHRSVGRYIDDEAGLDSSGLHQCTFMFSVRLPTSQPEFASASHWVHGRASERAKLCRFWQKRQAPKSGGPMKMD
eukprot:5372060-Pyramimonas_sp.AAC.1